MALFISEMWSFMKDRKKFWMLPLLMIMLLLGGLLILSQGSVIAPLIYTIF